LAHDAARGIHREVDAGIEDAGGDHRHDGYETLERHRAVPDRPGVRFASDHLRRGAGRYQRMEAGNRTAGDGDEAEREDLAGEDGAGAVNELRERRHL
jgi:hypothetical protein